MRICTADMGADGDPAHDFASAITRVNFGCHPSVGYPILCCHGERAHIWEWENSEVVYGAAVAVADRRMISFVRLHEFHGLTSNTENPRCVRA